MQITTLPAVDYRRPKPRPHRFTPAPGKAWRPLLAAFVTFAFIADTNAGERSSVDSATPVDVVSSEDFAQAGAASVESILKNMVVNGTPSLNIRLRGEVADQDGKQTSQAYTVRTRLGFTTGEYNGFYAHIDVEDIRAADDSLYNAAGTNAQPDKTNIADPQDTELNQLFANFDFPAFNASARVGRQRIKLDDDRFIGNVGWRQNEQTYDAVRLDVMPTDKLDLTYAYIWDVNRIFGPDADRDFTSDSHIIHLAYDDARLGKITGFAYLLDFDGEATAASNSSDTYGIRYEATRNLKGDPDGPKLNYVLSWATQSDAGDNPDYYTANYYRFEAKVINDGWYFGGGWELLGSDNGVAAFQTPLATLHGQNGWADAFLTTPDDGLEDTFVYLGGDLPGGYKGKAVYHWFDPDNGSADYGEEFDAVVSKKLSDNATVLAKYAYYDGDAAAFADRAKFWLQLTLNY